MIKNLSKINPLKRDQVEKAASIVSNSGLVRRLIIFGSSVTEHCTPESDVDLCLDITCDSEDLRLFYMDSDIIMACDRN